MCRKSCGAHCTNVSFCRLYLRWNGMHRVENRVCCDAGPHCSQSETALMRSSSDHATRTWRMSETLLRPGSARRCLGVRICEIGWPREQPTHAGVHAPLDQNLV